MRRRDSERRWTTSYTLLPATHTDTDTHTGLTAVATDFAHTDVQDTLQPTYVYTSVVQHAGEARLSVTQAGDLQHVQQLLTMTTTKRPAHAALDRSLARSLRLDNRQLSLSLSRRKNVDTTPQRRLAVHRG